ncbi:uncharacterized protein [Ptychodera flava]|uniref:uncharacterized protein n=1 Tax=Ptychodera flava TaxID=63121 RepID=UPI00396A38BC
MPLCDEDIPLCDEVMQLCGEVIALCDEDMPLCDEDMALCDEVMPLCDEDMPLCDEVMPLCDENPAEHRRNRGNRAKKCKRTWTGQFVCLADRNASSVPSSEIKQILTRAGLGLKRLTFDSECKSRDLMDTLMSDAGFPQLRDCGGVELLHCAYAKQLKVITCNWSVPDLKTNLGSQSKIYIRPIQKNLSTKPISSETDETLITQTCMGCNKEFNIRELRDHLWTCTARSDEDEDDVSYEYDRNEEQEDLNIIDPVDNTSDTANGTTNMIPNMDVQQSAAASNPDNTPMDDSLPKEETVDDVVTATYEYCNTNSVSDPVEILKIFQSKMVTGRKLDIEDSAVLVEGETNFIMVDRSNILRTAIDEICLIDNPRLTLEVEFYGEEARDLGGPRKEFFTEVLREIHDKYFENGLKQHLEEDYKTVGVIMGLSTLQNGRIPQFMGEEVRQELFQSPFPSPCIEQLRQGFDKLGICKLAKKLPLLLHLFVPNANSALTFRKLKTLLKPKFSPEGSNNRKHENDVYTIFIAYMREAAGKYFY